MINIYALSDPRTHEVRYVGQTRLTVERRAARHVDVSRLGGDAYLARWLRQLDRAGYRPLVALVQAVDDVHADDAETYWISYFRASGCPLTNVSSGGSGRRAAHSEETRRKIGDGNRGKVRTAEARARLAELRRGNQNARGAVRTPEQRAHLSRVKTGTKLGPLSDEAKAKISAKAKARWELKRASAAV